MLRGMRGFLWLLLFMLLQKLLFLLVQLRMLLHRLQQVFVPKLVLLVFVRLFLQLLKLLQLLLWVLAELRRMLDRLCIVRRIQLSGFGKRLCTAVRVADGELSSSSSQRRQLTNRAGTHPSLGTGDRRQAGRRLLQQLKSNSVSTTRPAQRRPFFSIAENYRLPMSRLVLSSRKV
jgi:hypothetical protein